MNSAFYLSEKESSLLATSTLPRANRAQSITAAIFWFKLRGFEGLLHSLKPPEVLSWEVQYKEDALHV